MRRDLLPLVRSALSDRYAIDCEIGRGGAAIVFRAATHDGQTVALKILRPELSTTVTGERFLREIRIISTLDHPKIGRLLDSGEKDWVIYFVMPLIEGPTLDSVLKRDGKLAVTDVSRLARDLLDALAHAHGKGIVHRDVKPDNIIVSRDGALLLDFGIARAVALSGSDKLTRSGIAVGTSHYMSPEQVMALTDIDGRSDLYSVGCVLFECLTGHPPYQHKNEVRVLQLHQTEPIPDLGALAPHVPDALVSIVTRALAKKPEDRWQSAEAMLRAVGRV